MTGDFQFSQVGCSISVSYKFGSWNKSLKSIWLVLWRYYILAETCFNIVSFLKCTRLPTGYLVFVEKSHLCKWDLKVRIEFRHIRKRIEPISEILYRTTVVECACPVYVHVKLKIVFEKLIRVNIFPAEMTRCFLSALWLICKQF